MGVLGKGRKTGITREEERIGRSQETENEEKENSKQEDEIESDLKQDEIESDSEVVIPESKRIPNTPSIEEYSKHQITHYPYQAWCPICVKIQG